MVDAMEGKQAFADVREEIGNLMDRMNDLKQRMDTVLSADVVNDMMNAVARLSDVFNRVNLGKLEVSLNKVDDTMGNVVATLDTMVVKLGDAVEMFKQIDFSKVSAGSGVGYMKIAEDIEIRTAKLKDETEAWKDLQAVRKAALRDAANASTKSERGHLQYLSQIGALLSEGDEESVKKSIGLMQRLSREFEALSETTPDTRAGNALQNRYEAIVSVISETIGALKKIDGFDSDEAFEAVTELGSLFTE